MLIKPLSLSLVEMLGMEGRPNNESKRHNHDQQKEWRARLRWE